MTKARDLANSAAAFAAVSATELGYVDGVTSAIQTQIDAKAPSSTAATLSGTQTLTNKTIDTASNTITGAVTLTGTQTLTNKTLTSPVIASVINNTLTSTTGDIIYASAANTPARLGIGSASQVLSVSSGIPAWTTPAASGLIPISSAAFTSVSSVSLATNTFTSTYKNYRLLITFDGGASPGTLTARVRRSGTDDTGGNYYAGGEAVPYTTGATVINTSGGTSFPFAITNVGGTFPRTALSLDIYVPLGTNGKIAAQGVTDYMGSLSLGLWNSGNTAFDSLTFLLSSGNMTGYYQVFAYPN